MMYKKITKTTKVVKVYSTPAEEQADRMADVQADDGAQSTDIVTTSYGDTINLDVPLFVKLLAYVQTRVATVAELQALSDSVVAMSKTTPIITLDDFQRWANINL